MPYAHPFSVSSWLPSNDSHVHFVVPAATHADLAYPEQCRRAYFFSGWSSHVNGRLFCVRTLAGCVFLREPPLWVAVFLSPDLRMRSGLLSHCPTVFNLLAVDFLSFPSALRDRIQGVWGAGYFGWVAAPDLASVAVALLLPSPLLTWFSVLRCLPLLFCLFFFFCLLSFQK